MCEIEDCFWIETGHWVDKKRKQFRRNDFLPFNGVKALRRRRNNKGIFTTAYRYNSKNQDEAFLYGDLYLDFDCENDFELVREDVLRAISYIKVVFKIKDSNKFSIFYSGNKGAHIVVPAEVLGIEPDKHLNEVFKTIAIAIKEFIKNDTLDMQIYDNKRLFRVPNSIHESTNRYKIYMTESEFRGLSQEEIKQLAQQPRPIPQIDKAKSREANTMFLSFKERTQERVNSFNNVKSTGTLKYTPPCIKTILEEGAQEGQRNHTIAVLASYYKSSGRDLKEATELIDDWNSEKTSSPVHIKEISRTLRSIYSCEKAFGCTAIKALSLCSDSECRFKKEN